MGKRKLTIGVAILLMLAVGAWAFGLFGGADPAVAKLQEMADQAFNSNMPEAQQDQMRDQFRQQMQALTPQQRDAFFDANRGRWMERAEQRMDEFFAMSQQEQQKRLDEILNRMSQPRENRGREAGRGDRGGRGGWQNMTEAQREERSKRRLDSTSPRMRAQMSEFRKKLADRAKQRGMGDLPNRWGFPGGRG
jgi:type I site-specific restriction-modification system R (restriction) subunit